jgi:carbonic anhydrase
LEWLLEGNRLHAKLALHRDPKAFEGLTRGQSPIAALVGCVDARTPIDQVTGTKAGTLLISRNVANQADAAVAAMVQFGLDPLRIRHFVVCGHQDCGGIKYAMKLAVTSDKGHSDELTRWLAPLKDLYAMHRSALEGLSESERVEQFAILNIRTQVQRLAESPVIRIFHTRFPDPITIQGWYLRLSTGQFEVVANQVVTTAQSQKDTLTDALLDRHL